MNLSWDDINKFKIEDFVPEKKSDLHLWMLKYDKRDRRQCIYGDHWCDPMIHPALKTINRYFIKPIVPGKTVVEIGPGGGRWTRFLRYAKKLYLVDPFVELLRETKKNFNGSNMEFIQNNGTDFPGIPEDYVDYIFCFDVFVHLSADLIREYLLNMKKILKKGYASSIFFNYADNTKAASINNKGYAQDTNPAVIHQIINDLEYTIIAENHTAFDCSNTIWIRHKAYGKATKISRETYYHTNEITK